MNYEEFKQEVTDRIKDFLPEKYVNAEVSIQTVVKNNDQKLDGLMIKQEDNNICPNIYLKDFYEQYENGRDMNDILSQIADVRTQHEMEQGFDVSRLTDFDSVKDRITCRLVNAEQNAEYLADKPHTMVDDLAVTYHIALGSIDNGTMSAPVTNRLMEEYHVNAEQLHQIALENMDTLTPATFKSMRDTMVEMMMPEMMSGGRSEAEAREMIDMMIPPASGEMMYVLSNQDKVHGAAVVLNDKVMDDITEKVGGEFYILPSSVHELLIVPKTEEVDLRNLEAMVREVNANEVAPQDRLSDHVYAYDVKEHELFRADKAEERAAAKEAVREEKADPARDAVKQEGRTSEKAAKSEQKQERPSLKARLAEKKEAVAKAEANREPRQMNKKREQVLA